VALWNIADRFGRVRSDGVLVPLPLSHAALGRLVGSRPTVSLAIKDLTGDGRLSRTRDGYWVLSSDRGTTHGCGSPM
jgi:hypothetical protein